MHQRRSRLPRRADEHAQVAGKRALAIRQATRSESSRHSQLGQSACALAGAEGQRARGAASSWNHRTRHRIAVSELRLLRMRARAGAVRHFVPWRRGRHDHVPARAGAQQLVLTGNATARAHTRHQKRRHKIPTTV